MMTGRDAIPCKRRLRGLSNCRGGKVALARLGSASRCRGKSEGTPTVEEGPALLGAEGPERRTFLGRLHRQVSPMLPSKEALADWNQSFWLSNPTPQPVCGKTRKS